MLHSTSLLHHNNNRFLFFSSFHSNSHSHTLSFSKSLSSPSLQSLPSPSSLCCRVARVSTKALELSPPPPPELDLRREIERLAALREKLAACGSPSEKLRVLDADYRVRRFFGSRQNRNSAFSRVLDTIGLGSEELFLLKCLVAAGQEHVLEIGGGAGLDSDASSLKSALYALAEMIDNLDSFNRNGGGSGSGNKMGVALEDEEIRDLNKLLETLGEIERFYDCIGGIIGSVLHFFTRHSLVFFFFFFCNFGKNN